MKNYIRPRRNRKSESIRSLVEETRLSPSQLIFPLFVKTGTNQKDEIASMPGIYRYSEDLLLKEVESCMELGLKNFCLFPLVPDEWKDSSASYALKEENFYLKALRKMKETFPEMSLMTDVALDPYSSDGHDGIVRDGKILNDETVEILAEMALMQAQAGVDMIGPSDMMDGRIAAIREKLDKNSYTDTSIISYSAKYASAFYGPFRDALESAPKEGDKKTYQLNPANKREALLEAKLDEAEGADILMVKPALSYLDIIADLRKDTLLPIAAYNVSGEYAMVKAAAKNSWIDEKQVVEEILLSMTRAGASIILSYHAKDYLLNQK